MKLGETILALRKSFGMTQETVANALDVSIAAVSKWECGNAYPDIELLPRIAALFDVSVDYLMDYRRTAERTVAEHIAHAYALVKHRDERAADDYMTEVLARYPENDLVRIECAKIKRICTHGSNESAKAKELLCDAEKILKSVNVKELSRREYDLYYAALAQVWIVMKRFGDAAAALDEIMPDDTVHPEQLRYYLELECGNTSSAIAGMQKMLWKDIHDILVTSSWYYAAYPDDPAKVIEQNETCVRLLEAVTGGAASPFDRDLCYACECISFMYARLGDRERSVESFRRAMDYAVRFDGIEKMTYRTLPAFAMLDEAFDAALDYYPHGTGDFALARQTANIVTEAGEERREYALIRDDERVREIVGQF